MADLDKLELQQKLNNLFSESDQRYSNENLAYTDRSELVDLSEEEIREVAEYVKRTEDKKALKKRAKFTFSYFGKILFNFLIILLEIIIVSLVLYILVPFAINKEVTLLNCFSSTIILAVINKWIKK